jgi:hypothetical protein
VRDSRARCPAVERNHVVSVAETRVVELGIEPRRVEEDRVQQKDGRLVGVEVGGMACAGVRDVPDRDKVIVAGDVDKGHAGRQVGEYAHARRTGAVLYGHHHVDTVLRRKPLRSSYACAPGLRTAHSVSSSRHRNGNRYLTARYRYVQQ